MAGPGGLGHATTQGFAPQPAESTSAPWSSRSGRAACGRRWSGWASPAPCRPGAGLTVYRIAQEALTNVLKHAGPDPVVTVLVQWLPDAIVVEVSDDGRGASADTDGLGQGLLGMRERATMFGGTVTAGPRPGGGFRVRAQLPTPGAPPRAPTRERPTTRADRALPTIRGADPR